MRYIEEGNVAVTAVIVVVVGVVIVRERDAGPIVQLDRMAACGAVGRGFESLWARYK